MTSSHISALFDTIDEKCIAVTGSHETQQCINKRECLLRRTSTPPEILQEFEELLDALILSRIDADFDELSQKAHRLAELSICARCRRSGKDQLIAQEFLRQRQQLLASAPRSGGRRREIGTHRTLGYVPAETGHVDGTNRNSDQESNSETMLASSDNSSENEEFQIESERLDADFRDPPVVLERAIDEQSEASSVGMEYYEAHRDRDVRNAQQQQIQQLQGDIGQLRDLVAALHVRDQGQIQGQQLYIWLGILIGLPLGIATLAVAFIVWTVA